METVTTDGLFENYSVLMSVYINDVRDWVKEAIESMLNQTVRTNDFVVICDGQVKKEVDDLLSDYENRLPDIFHVYRKDQNEGLGPTLAFGITKCKNELVARMDADDISKIDRCEKELSFFASNPQLDVVGCWEDEFENLPENRIAIHKVPTGVSNVYSSMKRRCSLLHPTVIYKKSSVIQCGNYHDVRLFEDYDLFMRMIVECEMLGDNVPESLYLMRVNDDFYRRRGGWKYMRTVVSFKKEQYKKKHISFKDYFVSKTAHVIVCLLPNRVRKWFYLKMLRK